LAEIWSYIAEEASETTANRFLARLEGTCQKLLPFPSAHPERPQLAPGLRVTFQGAYAIYYQFDDTHVVIIRVLHGARDVTAIAEQGGFDG
jgi:toxin ParE1/3/4